MNRILAVVAATFLALSGPSPAGETVTVFAAASLKEALDAQARRFKADTGNRIVVSYGGSNALARQIEAGAPADVFLSADAEWMDYLDTRSLLAPGTRVDLLGNWLVLIVPAASTSRLRIAPNFPLASALGADHLAMANPGSVPAGRYGKAALMALGVWASVEAKIARTENVRAALKLVARSEAPYGIVYATDALAEPGVRVLDTFPANTHPPVVYPIAVIAASRSPAAARALVAYLASDAARVLWQRYGFAPIARTSP